SRIHLMSNMGAIGNWGMRCQMDQSRCIRASPRCGKAGSLKGHEPCRNNQMCDPETGVGSALCKAVKVDQLCQKPFDVLQRDHIRAVRRCAIRVLMRFNEN